MMNYPQKLGMEGGGGEVTPDIAKIVLTNVYLDIFPNLLGKSRGISQGSQPPVYESLNVVLV